MLKINEYMKSLLNNHKFTIIQFPIFAIGAFVLLLALAMQIYPGGTVERTETVGYLFTENYISDLGRTVSHSGVENTLSFFIFLFAFAIMTCAFFTYFYGNYTFFKKKYSPQGNMFKLGTFFGMCTSLCFLGVALTPADINLKDHVFFAEYLFRFLFGGAFLLALSYFKMDRLTQWLGLGYLLIAIATGVYILLSDFELNAVLFSNEHLAEVITQKLITGTLIFGFLLVGYFNFRNLKQQ
tara:strand:- start:2217 stop:2936 length:720 start_codon:yes stop_codon:yes gene_type:complete